MTARTADTAGLADLERLTRQAVAGLRAIGETPAADRLERNADALARGKRDAVVSLLSESTGTMGSFRDVAFTPELQRLTGAIAGACRKVSEAAA